MGVMDGQLAGLLDPIGRDLGQVGVGVPDDQAGWGRCSVLMDEWHENRISGASLDAGMADEQRADQDDQQCKTAGDVGRVIFHSNHILRLFYP
jgi:hypothetical protein